MTIIHKNDSVIATVLEDSEYDWKATSTQFAFDLDEPGLKDDTVFIRTGEVSSVLELFLGDYTKPALVIAVDFIGAAGGTFVLDSFVRNYISFSFKQ